MTDTLPQSYQQRFAGIARLYGEKALQRLYTAHFVVAGLGGVGSWSAEALARSGVGRLTLIDMDDVCVSNSNRQLHTVRETIGLSKTQVMADRLLAINPLLQVTLVDDFLDADNLAIYLGPQHDVVIDAIDAASVKAAMVAYCRARRIRLVMAGSAGGKSDPTRVMVADLGKTVSDPLLAKVRQQLYRRHNFARSTKRSFGVDAVFSTEQAVFPKPDGEVCQQKSAMVDGVKLDCSGGFGAATMLTGTIGFVAAEKAIKRYLQSAVPTAAD